MGLEERTIGSWALTLHELRESADPLDFMAGGFEQVAAFEGLDSLTWFDELPGVDERFAGYGEYCCSFALDKVPDEAYLRLPE